MACAGRQGDCVKIKFCGVYRLKKINKEYSGGCGGGSSERGFAFFFGWVVVWFPGMRNVAREDIKCILYL